MRITWVWIALPCCVLSATLVGDALQDVEHEARR